MPKVTLTLSGEAAAALMAWDALGGLAGPSLSARCAFIIEDAARSRAHFVAGRDATQELQRIGILSPPPEDQDDDIEL